jgi:hypothetical protein
VDDIGWLLDYGAGTPGTRYTCEEVPSVLYCHPVLRGSGADED